MPRSLLPPFLLLAACSSPTEPTTTATMDFRSTILFGIPTLAPTAVGSEGEILVSGVIHTVGTGFTFTATLSVSAGNEITVEIDGRDNAPGLPFPVQNYYRGAIRKLAPGDYDVSIVYDIHHPAPGRRERVFHQTVRVK